MNEIDANQQGLKNFVVLYREPEQAVLDAPRGFQCWAEDGDHAEEQCSNAWPDADVVWVWQGPFGVGVQPALDDYYTTWLASEVDAARNPRPNAPGDSGMVEVLVRELDEQALDWVVQKCEGLLTPDGRLTDAYCDSLGHDSDGGFSTDWAQGGPILEREGIWVIERYKGVWDAFKKIPWENRWKGVLVISGPTYLAAGMRCFSVSRLGDKVAVPSSLVRRAPAVVDATPDRDDQEADASPARERDRG